ncbi:transglycosylase domain-containing protein [Nocardiopsis sp. MG754419]|uniref:transglycosylase domain-containing protein n=1 Tax=Nocardiopsis sp. MG754419 TaxID=2259865 RepID=UPI001BABB387|nr:transglycosylase domain-containing protein [Nocardiopsis sp. MG754419]MBR8744793.1 penicillin-binding protein [Nocardiopsis sp. MG754419]
MPDVICHGGGELSESTHGDGGTDGRRPDSNTPEKNDASAEELSSQTTPQRDVPTTGEDQSGSESGVGADTESGNDDGPEPEFVPGSHAFKTSGTFFRDRVARTLAEQGYGNDEVSSDPGTDTDTDTETDSEDRAVSQSGTGTRDTAGSEDATGPETDTDTSSGTDATPGTDSHSDSGRSETTSGAGSWFTRDPAPSTDETTEAGADTDGDVGTARATNGVEDDTDLSAGPDSDPAHDSASGSASAAPTSTAPFADEDTGDTDDVGTLDPDTEVTGAFPIPVFSDVSETPESPESDAEGTAEAPSDSDSTWAAKEGSASSEDAESAMAAGGVESPADDAPATAEEPPTRPFTPVHDAPDDASPKTEAMPAPAADAVAFAAPPPEEGPESPTDTAWDEGDRTAEQRSAPADDDEMWPQPRRMSDFRSEQQSEDEDSSGAAGVAAGAGAVAGAAAAGSASAQSAPGGPGGPSGPGGPKGPPGGPGGPKGPGDKGGKGDKKKVKKPLWWRVLRTFLVITGLFIIAGCGVFAFFYATVEVPDAAKADAVEQGSTFYFADGETEFAYRGTDREVIDYDRMIAGGDHVVEAVISAEDRGFWTEPGVSVSGTMRAVWSTISGEQVQGGSTVTQQMVRNYYEGVSLDQTVARKVQEIIIAIKVDQSQDKEWVMEQYLNTIYFGRMSYGVQAAAQAYYHKDVDELTAEEAAFLAAAIQQPTHFGQADVETTPAMENRWQYVIDGMVTTEAITQAEADEMEFPAPEPEKSLDGADISGYKGYMLQEAMSELERLGYTEDHINRQGYTIVTTFDKDMMDAAYETVEEMVPQENLPEGVNIGLSTIDPATGEVLAFYGGHDYVANQYDSSFRGAAQAGSAFKPYVLATALEQGYGLNSTVDGRGPREIQGSRVQNAGNDSGGVMTLTQATQVSNNLGFVELAQEVGFEQIRETAYDVGLPNGSIDDNQLVPVMPLGATSVRPIDQASGYATFANGGVHIDAHVVKEVVNQEGEDERPEVEERRALEESTAADVTHALEQVVNAGTGTRARLWDHPVAGKTGTTDGSVAAWFVGYTPQLSTSVGVYSGNNESFSIPGHDISGGGLPAAMWNAYMTRAMDGYERGSFPSPAFGGSTENWAPDPNTQQPQEPQEPQEPEAPVEPEEPQEPEVPEEPEEPISPEPPIEEPGEPGDPNEPGIPDFPPGRNDE